MAEGKQGDAAAPQQQDSDKKAKVEFSFSNVTKKEDLEFMARLADAAGEHEAASHFRNKAGVAQSTTWQKFHRRQVPMGTILIGVGVVLVTVGLYEALRYALREKYPNMWAVVGDRYSHKMAMPDNVRKLKTGS